MTLNKAILVGNMVRDPELQALPSGTKMCKFTIAINHRTKESNEVCFIDVVAWAKQAEFVSTYFKKGKGILVEGRLKTDMWTSKDGKQMSKLIVVAEDIKFMGSDARETDDAMMNEHKRIDPLKHVPSEQSKRLASEFMPKDGQKSVDGNILDSSELPF